MNSIECQVEEVYTYAARQPIVDRNINVIGYELLYRDSPNNAFPDIDPSIATQHILIEQFMLRQYHILNGKVGFVNFDNISLLKRIPEDFSTARFVVEILETCTPNDELYELLQELKQRGYKIALDDFIPSNKWDAFLPLIDIIKFDIRICSIPRAGGYISQHQEFNIEFIAEKVETYEEFTLAKEHGFTYFQGYFFKKPEMIINKQIRASVSSGLQLCKEVANENIDFKKIESIISKDTVFSFQLLSFVNACSRIATPIKSFHQALVYLGEDKLRKFVSYTALVSLNEKKPKQLFYMSLHRAKFFELLIMQSNFPHLKEQAYLCGLLSLINSLLDSDTEHVIKPLNISDTIKDALITNSGPLGMLLLLAESLENGDWDDIAKKEKLLGLSMEATIMCDIDAHLWIHDVIE